MNNLSYSVEDILDFASAINFDKYLFQDTLPVIEEAKTKGYKIVILTFGHQAWQEKKIVGCGLDKVADKVFYVTFNGNGAKAEKLKEYAGNSRKIIFVDNSGNHLDEMVKVMPEVETYFINRVSNKGMDAGENEYMRIRYMESRKIAERKLSFSHNHCNNFKDIVL